jgi:hypothetical protein
MSLRFVESDLTTTRLSLTYIEGLTRIPLPENLKNWGESSRAHGKTLISDKYDNITITLALRVEGTDAATRDAAIRALVAEITRDNILEFIPGGSTEPIYYETFKYDTSEAQGLLTRTYGENPDTPMVYPFMVELQAKPFAQGGWEDLTPLESLVPDWSFEEWPTVPEYNQPSGVTAYGDYVYVCDTYNHRIVKLLASNLTLVDQIGSLGAGNDQFNSPYGITTDGTHLYIADYGNHRIVKRDLALVYVDMIGTEGNGDDQFQNPCGITNDGVHLYVADTYNHRIVKRTLALVYDSKIGSFGTGNDGFNRPTDIATDGTHIYVTDALNYRIVKRLCADLSYVDEVGSLGTGDDEFNYPQGIDIFSGYIFVVDRLNNRIVKRNADDLSYRAQVGGLGSGNNYFNDPTWLAADGTSYIYIADSNNNRIVKRLAFDLSFVLDSGAWIPTEVNGAGTATADQSDTQALFGSYSCKLKITSDDGEAYITSPFITIDRTQPHALLVNYYHAGGGDSLSIKVEQYEEDGTPLADLLDDTGIGGTTAWRSIQYELTGFHADCAQVKIEIKVDTAIAEFYIDGIAFADARYLSEGLIANPIGFAIPAADIKGDLPAPVDIYIQKWDDTVAETAGILVGQRKEYDADFTPRVPTDQSATDAYSSLAGFDEVAAGIHMGLRRSIPFPGQLLVNGGFEAWTGVNCDNWTRTPGAHGVIAPLSNGPYKGNYYVYGLVDASPAESLYMTSDLMVVNPAEDYVADITYRLNNVSSRARLVVELLCYQADGTTPTQTITILDTKAKQAAWKPKTLKILAAQWNALTARARFRWTFTGTYIYTSSSQYWDWCALDAASFRQSSYSYIFDGSEYIDRIKGYVHPALHYYLNAAQADRAVELYGNLVHDVYGEIGGVNALQRATLNMPATWIFEDGFRVMNLPTSGMGPEMDLSDISQRIVAHIDSAMTAGTVYMDELALIPQDEGAAYIPAESNRYIVLDSMSPMPLILKSFDGTKTKAMVEDNAILKRRFTLDPGGTNYAVLIRHVVDDGEIAQFTANVRLRYRPRYLVVA